MNASLRSVFIVIFAALAIVGAELAREGDGAHYFQYLHYLFKPLTTLSIFLLAWQASPNPGIAQLYRRAMLAGIACSLLGDILLMLPASVLRQGFLLGLLSFLCAHICFLRALISDCRFAGKPVVFAFIAMLGIANVWVLWPGLPNAMQIPVITYVCLLLSMTAQAVSRSLVLRTSDSRLALFGGLFFMLSDCLLAYNKFHGSFVHSPLLVLSSYYLALWLMANSVKSSVVPVASTTQ